MTLQIVEMLTMITLMKIFELQAWVQLQEMSKAVKLVAKHGAVDDRGTLLGDEIPKRYDTYLTEFWIIFIHYCFLRLLDARM